MNDFPSLDELLDYGEDYKVADLIESDYFIADNSRKQQNNQSKDSKENTSQESNTNQESNEKSKKNEQPSDSTTTEKSTENEENTSQESNTNQESNEKSEKNKSQNIEESEDENDFDNLLNNYEENSRKENNKNESTSHHSASDKIYDTTPTKIYKVLKKLVSLSYESYQKGTYKYNKKEIIKHYLTEQKFKIIDDLMSPVFKPDIYVFDLSPSNDNSLEMYVNAISSVAIKGSLIYLTYNNEILRKLYIKKQNSKGIDVKEYVNSENNKYDNIECTTYNEYQSLYEELKNERNRKIYIFSDLDISSDMVKLSEKNKNIVWFSTENNSQFYNFYTRDVPSEYDGLYVDTKDITDIEKYIKEKNKSRYRRRRSNGK